MLPRFATSTRRLRIGILLAIPVLASTVVAQIVSDNEVPRDQIQGRWMNFEVAVQNAFEFDPRGLAVYAINQPGSRVVARNSANLELLWEAPMGIGLTSIRLRRGSNELWCVDRVAGAISVIDLRTGKITNTVQTSADPHDLVFDVQQKRAYVTCSASNCVDIVNTNTYKVVKSIDIPAMQPRGITRVGTTVFVTPFMSGNGTAPMGNAQTGDNADVRTIEHVDQIPGVNALPDSDLFAINITASPATDALDHSRTVSGLGTMLYNIHHRPGTNELWIPHTEALNADFVGERNFIAGQVVRNRIAVVKANNGSLVNMIDLDALAPAIDQRCSTPTHVSFSPDGTRAFVTGYGSDSMAVLDLNGPHVSWAGTIDIQRQNLYPDGAGPRASRINFTGEQMWIYNKGENSYARVFLADLPGTPNFEYLSPKARSNGWDPTPADINQGRIHFIRTDNSLSQTSSCDSCHSDGGSDGLAWDLSAYLDPEGTPADQLAFPMDLKGPMVSQPLRHLREVGPFHWRGDNKSLQDFDNIFVTLLERHENGQSGTLTVDFRYLSQFLEHLAVPANPMQAMDRVYTSDQLLGADLFMNLAVRDNLRCVDCHSLPLGTSGEIVDHLDGGLSPTTVIPPLRGIFSKLAKPFHIGGDFGMRTELGGGLTHNGAGSSVAGHLMQSLASGARRFNLTDNQALTIEDFLRSLDTGLAPATAFQVTATPDNFMQVRQNELMYLVNQANLGNCDIVYRYGPVNYNGSSRYMTGTYNPASGGFMQGSAVLPELTLSDLIRLPENGMPVTFLGTPLMMGQPLGIDRDNDKLRDLDELARGTNPENDDTDNDGLPDGYEVFWTTNPNALTTNISDSTPPQVIGNARVVFTTTNAIKFELETDEPTRMYIGYNDAGPFLRAPLFPKHDTHFSEIIGELQPGTDYTVQLNLNDPAGNSVMYEFQARTKDFVQPEPVHVSDIQMTLSNQGSSNVLRVRLTLNEGDAPAQPGYSVTGSIYHEGTSSVQLVAAGAQAWLTSTNGQTHFYVDIPPNILPGMGELHFVVDQIDEPPGRPAYIVGENEESTDSIPF